MADVDKGDELKVAEPGVVEVDKAVPETPDADVADADVADADVVEPDVVEPETAEFDCAFVSFSRLPVTSL